MSKLSFDTHLRAQTQSGHENRNQVGKKAKPRCLAISPAILLKEVRSGSLGGSASQVWKPESSRAVIRVSRRRPPLDLLEIVADYFAGRHHLQLLIGQFLGDSASDHPDRAFGFFLAEVTQVKTLLAGQVFDLLIAIGVFNCCWSSSSLTPACINLTKFSFDIFAPLFCLSGRGQVSGGLAYRCLSHFSYRMSASGNKPLPLICPIGKPA